MPEDAAKKRGADSDETMAPAPANPRTDNTFVAGAAPENAAPADGTLVFTPLGAAPADSDATGFSLSPPESAPTEDGTAVFVRRPGPRAVYGRPRPK